MSARFGYSAAENPFNDPNLNESFSWKKKVEQKKGAAAAMGGDAGEKKEHQ